MLSHIAVSKEGVEAPLVYHVTFLVGKLRHMRLGLAEMRKLMHTGLFLIIRFWCI